MKPTPHFHLWLSYNNNPPLLNKLTFFKKFEILLYPKSSIKPPLPPRYPPKPLRRHSKYAASYEK